MNLIILNIPSYVSYKMLKTIIEKSFNQKCILRYKPGFRKAKVSIEIPVDLENVNLMIRKCPLKVKLDLSENKKTNKKNNYFIDYDIRDRVSPLHKLPYENQVSAKIRIISEFYKKNLGFWDNIEFCMSITSYRNGFEFTIENGNVGFRGPSRQDGNNVYSVDKVPFISKNTLKLINEVKKVNQEVPKEKIHLIKHLKIRENDKNTIALVSMRCEDAEVLKIIEKYPFSSLYVTYNDNFDGFNFSPTHKIRGSDKLTFKINNYCFRPSFYTFFQTNIPIFESLIDEIRRFKQNEILLDLCCGAGTIGIVLNDVFKSVIGIENNEACLDSFIESKLINKIENYEYVVGNIEDGLCSKKSSRLSQVIRSTGGKKITAVLDPPRAGVSKKTIRGIRELNIDQIFYVSCDYRQSLQNILDLTKPETKNYRRAPFSVISIKIFDMFVHTNQVEVLIHLKRDI